MAAPTTQRRPRRWLRIVARMFEAGLLVVALGTLAMWCSIPNTRKLATGNPTSTAFIDLRRSQAAADGRPFALKWTWKPIGKISKYLRNAVIDAEDANFMKHDGVDWNAIEKAVDTNLFRGNLSVGGSTITQQLAKNLYLSPSRSFIRKLREMLIAFRLEDHLTKQRILELYLNVVEWGDGIFGAEAAAQHWFGHSVQSLTPTEAVRLAIALPNPIQRAPDQRSPMLTEKAVRLIKMLRWRGLIDSAQERTALDEVGARDVKVQPFRDRSDEAEKPSTPSTPTSPTTTTLSPSPATTTRTPTTTTTPAPTTTLAPVGTAPGLPLPPEEPGPTTRSETGDTDRVTLPPP